MFLLWDSLSTEHVVKQLFAHGHLFDHFLIAARCAKIDFCGPLEDQKKCSGAAKNIIAKGFYIFPLMSGNPTTHFDIQKSDLKV
jgi:hypothetical protein